MAVVYLLPTCGFQRSNSGLWAWQQALLPSEPSSRPSTLFLRKGLSLKLDLASWLLVLGSAPALELQKHAIWLTFYASGWDQNS